MSFPLIVHGALMIEPTETESLREIDSFIEAMIAIAGEAGNDPQLVKTAPHLTRTSKVDEVTAARRPILVLKTAAGCTKRRRLDGKLAARPGGGVAADNAPFLNQAIQGG